MTLFIVILCWANQVIRMGRTMSKILSFNLVQNSWQKIHTILQGRLQPIFGYTIKLLYYFFYYLEILANGRHRCWKASRFLCRTLNFRYTACLYYLISRAILDDEFSDENVCLLSTYNLSTCMRTSDWNILHRIMIVKHWYFTRHKIDIWLSLYDVFKTTTKC